MFRDEWRWCHHKTEIGVDWAMFKRNFWRQVTCHDIYVLDECINKRSSNIWTSPFKNLHQITAAQNSRGRVVVLWCSSHSSTSRWRARRGVRGALGHRGVVRSVACWELLDVPCRPSRIMYCYNRSRAQYQAHDSLATYT